jgi:hypothetical protein
VLVATLLLGQSLEEVEGGQRVGPCRCPELTDHLLDQPAEDEICAFETDDGGLFLEVAPLVVALGDFGALVLGEAVVAGLGEVWVGVVAVEFEGLVSGEVAGGGAGGGVGVGEDAAEGGGPAQQFELRLLEDFLDVVLGDEVEGECLFGEVPGVGRVVCVGDAVLMRK